MPDARRVTNCEKKVGFRWSKGLSRSKGQSCKIGTIKFLIDDIDAIKQRWVTVLPSELRNNDEFKIECTQLYKFYAHRVWPRPPTDRSAWLVRASENDWNGLYPKDLFFDEHGEQLESLFCAMIFEKCVRYHENQKQKEKNTSVTHDEKPAWYERDSYERDSPEEFGEGQNEDSIYNRQSSSFAPDSRSLSLGHDLPSTESQPGDRRQSAASGERSAVAAPVALMVAPSTNPQPPEDLCSGTEEKETWQHINGKTQDVQDLNVHSSDDHGSNMESVNRQEQATQSSASCSPETAQYVHMNRRDACEITTASKRKASDEHELNAPTRKRQTLSVGGKKFSPESTSARERLKLKVGYTQQPSQEDLISSRSLETSNDSTIHVSRGRVPTNQIAEGEFSSVVEYQNMSAENNHGDFGNFMLGTHKETQFREDASIYDFVDSLGDPFDPEQGEIGLETDRQGSSYEQASLLIADKNATGFDETIQPMTSSHSNLEQTLRSGPVSMQPFENMTSELEGEIDRSGLLREAENALVPCSNVRHAYVEDEPETTTSATPHISTVLNHDVHDCPASQGSAQSIPRESESSTAGSIGHNFERRKPELYTKAMQPNVVEPDSVDNDVNGDFKEQDASAIPTPLPTPKNTEAKTDQVPSADRRSIPAPTSNWTSGDNVAAPAVKHDLPTSSTSTARGKKLLLQLNSNEVRQKQFIIVYPDCGIEQLFEKAQARINGRLDHKLIRYLLLCTPDQAPGDDPWRIERDDPETWEVFLEMVEEEYTVEKIKVTAEIEC